MTRPVVITIAVTALAIGLMPTLHGPAASAEAAKTVAAAQPDHNQPGENGAKNSPQPATAAQADAEGNVATPGHGAKAPEKPSAADLGLEAALAAWEKSAAALQSYDLFLRIDTADMTEHPKVDPKSLKSREELAAEPRLLPPGIEPSKVTEFARQVLSKQGKRRCEDLDPKGDSWSYAKVFDGKVVRWLSRKGGTAGVSAAGPDKAAFASYYKDYGALYRDLPVGASLVSLLRFRQGTRIVEGHGEERSHVVIESPPGGDPGIRSWSCTSLLIQTME
jgi:hypothetical protein